MNNEFHTKNYESINDINKIFCNKLFKIKIRYVFLIKIIDLAIKIWIIFIRILMGKINLKKPGNGEKKSKFSK